MEAVKQKKEKTKHKIHVQISKAEILKQIAFFAAFVVLRFCGRDGFAQALCFGFFTACVFGRQNAWVAVFGYILSSLPFGLDVTIYSGVSAVIVLAAYLGMTLMKRPTTKWLLLLVSIVGQAFFLIYNTSESAVLVQKLFDVAVGVTFSFVSSFTLRCVLLRGLRYRLNEDEKICAAVFVICLSMGLAYIVPLGFPVVRFAASFCVLFVLFVFGSLPALYAAILMGAGSAFATAQIADIAIIALWAVAVISFKKLPRALVAFTVPMTDFAVKYFFQNQEISLLGSVAVICGAFLFLCVPKKALDGLGGKLGSSSENFASRHIINRTRSNLSNKLFDLSEIFFEMRQSFFAMVQGVLPREKAKIVLAKEVSSKICADCQERTRCWRTNILEMEQGFADIMENSLDRGKATILDLPDFVAQNCKRLNTLLSYVNQAVFSYKQHCAVTVNADNSRLLIGEQLAGVSTILKNLSQQAQAPARYDIASEQNLFEELTYIGILTKEIVIATENDAPVVTLVVAAADSRKQGIAECVTKICRTNMSLAERTISANAAWLILTYMPAPKYDVSFGFAGVKKSGSEISGDTHTFLRISRDKFLLGLCDGMGSGIRAEKASSTAISLVENFYKAGFDNETILTSVNKLLTLGQEEVFTAVDICVADLKNGLCDFIKIGAPGGFIKSGAEVEFVSSGSLPMGVLDEMRPCITKKAMKCDDLVFMISDGILDAFGSKENVGQAIAQCQEMNPQSVADEIMRQALSKNPLTVEDDMTIIVARIFEKEAHDAA